MDKQIFDIIKRLSLNGFKLNEDAIMRIINILVNEYELNNHVKYVVFNSPVESTSYNPFDKKIVFNFDTDEDIKDIYITNLLYLYVIMHELTHVNQIKFLEDNDYNSIKDPLTKYKYRLTKEFHEYTILKSNIAYCIVPSEENIEFISKHCRGDIKDYEYVFNFRYNLFHDSFICEREADIEGLKYVIRLLKCYDPNSKCTQYFENMLRNIYLYSYSFYHGSRRDTPLNRYLDLFGYEDINNELTDLQQNINDEFICLPLELRMEYGLDIEHREYSDLENHVINERIKRLLTRN